MLDRLLALRPWLALGLALVFAVGCPPDDDDDDATPPPEDDDDDDDDDDVDPCLDVDDISDSVGTGDVVTGSNTGENDDFFGSCSNAAVPDALYSFVAAETATYIVSTDNADTDYDSLIFAFTDCNSSSTTELACNDDVVLGEITTSVMTFEADADQTVYIAVEGYDGSGNFGLTVDLVICGDELISGNELCDDGNEVAGDGCDESCQWECDDEDDREDDDVVEQATGLDAFPAEFEGFLCPTDLSVDYGVYIDLFEVTIEDEAAYLDASVAGGTLSPDCADQTLAAVILDPDVQTVAYGDTTEGECARAVAEPGIGTWYVGVFWDDQYVAPQDYTLTVSTGVSECGDSTTEGLEECDDGGTDPGDGCTPGCLDEEECPLADGDLADNLDADPVAGDNLEAESLHDPSCGAPGGGDVTYLFTAAAAGRVVFSLDGEGTDFDTVLHVRSVCADPDAEVACNDDIAGEDNRRSALGFVAEEGAEYAVIVDGWGAGQVGNFSLSAYTPVCGDETIDPGEECDDGNEDVADGCEPDCTITLPCAYTADEALGLLVSATPTEVTLALEGDDVTDVSCSSPGGGDSMVSFEVGTGGTATVGFAFEGKTDMQFEVWGPAADTCPVAFECFDPYPEQEGEFEIEVEPGTYYLVADAWQETFEGPVTLTITAP